MKIWVVISKTLGHVALCSQAFSHPISANHPHPVDRLAREVQQLKDKLAQISTSTDPNLSTKTAVPRRTDTNLNQNANNGTFLFPTSRPQGMGVLRAAPPPTSTNHQTSRGPPPATAPPSRPSHKDNGGSNKHTFLFGHSSVADARPEQRYYPAPSNTKLPKSNSSIASWGLAFVFTVLIYDTDRCTPWPGTTTTLPAQYETDQSLVGIVYWGHPGACFLLNHIWLSLRC